MFVTVRPPAIGVLLSVVLMSGLSLADDDGFRSLLNGHDLNGWVLVNTPLQTWSFQDGMLVCTGKPIGELRTNRMYQNFILELEWRHMVPGGNAGIFVWADDITSKGVPFHRGIEVQVLENAYGQSQHHTTHGDIFPIHGATMNPVNGRGGSRAFPAEERSKPSPEWNHYRIECSDGNISLAVNGKVVTRGTECSPRKGYICIESEGGVVHYRNMKIKELPDTAVDARHVAIANRGYRSIYSGLDLTGWTASAAGQSHWHPQDWVLHYDGKAASLGESTLTSAERLDNYGFLMDVHPQKGFEGLSVCGVAVPGNLQIGTWSRIEGTVRNRRMEVAVDGQVVLKAHPVPPAVNLSLASAGAANFANLYVRPLN